MRIHFFSEQFWPETNAPAIHVHERTRLWAAQGHEVTVITCVPNFPEGKVFPGYRNRFRQVEEVEGVRVLRVGTFISANQGFLLRTLDYLSFAVQAYLQGLGEEEPDVVISTSPQLLTGLAGLLYAKTRRRPHVFELRDLWPASIVAVSVLKPGPLIRFLERLELGCYRGSARVMAFTESFKEDLVRRGIEPAKVDVVPNGTNLGLFSPRPKDPEWMRRLGLDGHFVVGYLGTLGLAHGLDHVLSAAEALRDSDVAFLLVGPGAAREALEAEARRRGLDQVRFLPRQSREVVPALWSLCDAALVHLKDAEVFRTVIPSKLYEAAAMGLPVLLAGPEGEASRLVQRHQMGVVLPSNAPDRLAEAIREWRAHPDVRAEVAGRALAASRGFSREVQAERTLEVLARALAGSG